jgi:integrase
MDERDYFIQFATAIDPEFTKVVIVACHTGLRLGELGGLLRSELDFDRRMIRVRLNYSFKLKKELGKTKNRQIKEIPMNEAVYKVLKEHRLKSPTAEIFPKALLSNATHRFKSLCRKVDVKPLRFHDLRHTFASCLAMAGMDLRTIQELMRHKSIQMTMRYAHLHPEHLKGKTDVLCCTIPAQLTKKSPEAVTPGLI